MNRQPPAASWDRIVVRLPVAIGQRLRDEAHTRRKSVTLLIVEALKKEYVEGEGND